MKELPGLPRFADCFMKTQLIRLCKFSVQCAFPLLGGVLLFTSWVQAAERRKNVLFLIADDLNQFLGCYGDPLAKTPNLDRLAARGVLFERAYCGFPLCGPSRNSLLTGLYPNSTGILENAQIFRQSIPGHLSLPQAFRRQGWFAGRIGKLYHYAVPLAIGTDGHDDPASWELEINPAGVDRLQEEPSIFSLKPGQFGATLSWYASPQSDRFHTDAMLAADAEWVLERCAKERERPFFLAVGFFRPHTPFVAPKKPYFDQFSEDEMPVVRGIEEDMADIPAAAVAGLRKKEEDAMDDELRRQAVHAYHASVSFMDAQVGRVVDALDRLGLADDTTIVFTSDHGYHLGEHGLWQKRSLFEESARVPLILVVPGAARGSVVKTPVSHVDLYPTLMEISGIRGPENLQGQSLVPALRDPEWLGRGWALTHVTRGDFSGYSIRTPQWRYTEWDEGRKGRELYNHETDSKELVNLSGEAALAAKVKELSGLLREAVASSFPASKKRPTLRAKAWGAGESREGLPWKTAD